MALSNNDYRIILGIALDLNADHGFGSWRRVPSQIAAERRNRGDFSRMQSCAAQRQLHDADPGAVDRGEAEARWLPNNMLQTIASASISTS
jgi:hypothetical protein